MNDQKYVVVTGANGDIGVSICERLATDGYSLIALVHGSDAREQVFQEIAQKHNQTIDCYTCDFSSEEQTIGVLNEILKNYASLYGIVNNAGMYPIIPIEEYTLSAWKTVMSVNLTSAFLTTQMLFPLMKEKGGRIVNMSSTGAHLGSRDIAYSASKAGLIGITKSASRSLAKYNITVNAIAPGTIDTQMSRRMKEEDRIKNAENALLKRLGRPEDVSGVVSFLLSEDSNYITGFTIDVNGGMYIR